MTEHNNNSLHQYKVVRIEALTDTIMQVFAEPQTENDILNYQAGQYIELHVGDESRPFSIANAPLGTPRLEFHIRHSNDNDFINSLFTNMEQTKQLTVSSALGNCTFPDNDAPIIFIAGGTGFAPHKALIEYALAKHKSNPLYLIWGAFSLSDLYLHDVAAKWQQHIQHFHYLPVLQHVNDASWQGECGLVTDACQPVLTALMQDSHQPLNIFIAGPYEMVLATKKMLADCSSEHLTIFTDV